MPRTEKPTLRITRWLRRIGTPGPGIPFEAECTACADAKFQIKHDKRNEYGYGRLLPDPPDSDSYTRRLHEWFEEHLKMVHSDGRDTSPASSDNQSPKSALS